MTNQSYCATLKAARSPEQLFDRLTEVPKWWSKDYEGQSARLHEEFVTRCCGCSYTTALLFMHDGLFVDKECYVTRATGWEKVMKESLVNPILASLAAEIVS